MKRTGIKTYQALGRGRQLQQGGGLARSRLRTNWGRRRLHASFRRMVLERAEGRCERCDHEGCKLHVHHIVPRSRGVGWAGLHLPANGAALCAWCHGAVHDHSAVDWRRWLKRRPVDG